MKNYFGKKYKAKAKSKDDDIYKTNLIKLAERRAIKFALKSCASKGLERFADLCNKKLLEYTKALDHTGRNLIICN